MSMNQGTRVTVLITVVLGATLLCGIAALVTAREMQHLMQAMVSENLPSVTAANELQKALLQQRGLAAAYLLDGHAGWIQDLEQTKPAVARWIAEARETARTDEERRILSDLERAYGAYDGERERAIALLDAGRTAEAREVLLGDVSLHAGRVQTICRKLVAANEGYVQAALQDGHRRVGRLTLILAVGVTVVMLVGLGLLYTILRDVLMPVRRLAQDARAVAGETTAAAAAPARSEVRELEHYSRALMADISATRRDLEASQHRLVSAEKMAAVGKFAACVAHELRNPLTSMRMWLFQLQQAASRDPQLERSCRVIEDEIKRLDEVATSFLQFSRPPVLRLAPADICEIVDGTLELAQPRLKEKRLQVERGNGHGTHALPKVLADDHQLRQVLLNLVVNAAEATPEGGKLRIAESLERQGDDPPEVVVRIADGGPGVPESVQQRLFEPFVTTKPHGTGLGLCIASSIVDHHGGRLVLESSSDQGSVFAVRVPASVD